MNINEAKIFLDTILLNKNQSGGYLNASEFNSLARQAQLDLFSERYNNIKTHDKGNRTPPFGYESVQKITDDLRVFITTTELQCTANGDYCYATLPSDYAYLSSARVTTFLNNDGCGGTVQKGYVKIVPDSKIGVILNDDLLFPNNEYPIGNIQNSQFHLYPSTVQKCVFTYLRYPTSPVWGYTIVNGRQVYSSGTSVNFEFPEIVHKSILLKMLSYKGISIREQEIVSYAESKDAKEV